MDDFVILTADLDERSYQELESFRQRYFPVERNIVPAHLTLFHQLPRVALNEISLLKEEIPVSFSDPFFMGQGFAVRADCERLLRWRSSVLRSSFPFTKQDLSLRRLHVTIQNKREAKLAKQDYEAFLGEWKPLSGIVRGFRQWSYLGGPWKLEKIIPFT